MGSSLNNKNVKLVAKQLGEQQEKEVIIEPATLTATAIDKIQATNKLKFYIQPSLENRKYKISGTAWLDANKNGQREETETLLPNMQVMLVYKENGELVKDSETNMPKKITTDENGKYDKYEENHIQRAYCLDRIKELISEAGLEYVTSYDAFTKNAVRKDSERIYVIAREKGKKVS